jgi:GDP-L-fucose synthase
VEPLADPGFWGGQRVLVTGGSGFLGSFVVERLQGAGAEVRTFRSAEFDLRSPDACAALLADARPQVVVHCAVDGGGIGYMRAHPASIYTNNVLMNTNLLHASWAAGVERFCGVSSVCAYPRDAPVPMREDDVWTGYPEPSNAAYGLSKRMMVEQGLAYYQEHGFQCCFPMPVNLYGPRDEFDPARSHVVPALIRKCLAAQVAGDDHVIAWGTGTATRELLYVEDCADAVIRMAERVTEPVAINLGTGVETSVRELVETVAAVCGFTGEIRWDTTRPDGQPRKCLDVSWARERFDWTARVDLADGLARTVAWARQAGVL